MPIDKLFDGTIAVTAKALDLRAKRQGLIQSNIANINTPGYKVQEFSFKDAMEKATTGLGGLVKTNARHMDVDPLSAPGADVFSENRPVDVDEEMIKLAENQFMYQAAARIIAKKFDGLLFAIEEGGK